jgi:uncharacterized repeat protein (TIGR03843 family)
VTDDVPRGSADIESVLRRGSVSLEGRLVEASNATFYGSACLDGTTVECVYKPIRGERPLWDFPYGTLADREVAAYVVSEIAGWHVVPPTVRGDGPFGPGMVQAWVTDDADDFVDVLPAGAIPDGWLHVLDAVDLHEQPVVLVHRDDPRLRSMAVFDAVVNNADRKGGHVLSADGRVLGCDHGLTFHVDRKLRTILWGWAGQLLADDDIAALERLLAALQESPTLSRLGELISDEEIDRLGVRVDRLLRTRRHPAPPRDGRAIPWPAF